MPGRLRHTLVCVVSGGFSFVSIAVSGWFWLFFLVPLGSILAIDPGRLHGRSLYTLLSDLAQRYPLVVLLGIATVAAVTAGCSYGLTYWLDRAGPRTSAAAITRRLTRLGLVLVVGDALIVGAVVSFRWYLSVT